MTQQRSTETDGWGWWTALERQAAWLAEQDKAVPFPDDSLIPSGDLTVAALRERLQFFGSKLSFLYGRMGLLEGRQQAYDQVYKNALTGAKFRQEKKLQAAKIPKAQITESLKEQMALDDEQDDLGEKLREAKRLAIETDTLVATQKRLIDAYKINWATISRQLSGEVAEMELTRD